MPKNKIIQSEFDEDPSRRSRFKSARRQAARRAKPRTASRNSRGRERHISVRSELREQPDMRKVARAVIQMALAQAEAEAKAQAQAQPDQDEQAAND